LEQYFYHILSSLTINDMNLLAILYERESDVSFKAITKQELSLISNLTEYKFKKSIHRLEALNFIDVLVDGKQHAVFITRYGKIALEKNLEGDD